MLTEPKDTYTSCPNTEPIDTYTYLPCIMNFICMFMILLVECGTTLIFAEPRLFIKFCWRTAGIDPLEISNRIQLFFKNRIQNWPLFWMFKQRMSNCYFFHGLLIIARVTDFANFYVANKSRYLDGMDFISVVCGLYSKPSIIFT